MAALQLFYIFYISTLDFLQFDLISFDIMKTPRSTVSKNVNLATRVEKQRKGFGSYSRKAKFKKDWSE